ncbi:unnamed protein product, partial [Staurois parvus]
RDGRRDTHGQGRTDNSWGPRAIGGPCVLTHTQTTPKKAYERYQGHLMGPPTDPGPSGSARVFKWSVRPCQHFILLMCSHSHSMPKIFLTFSGLSFNYPRLYRQLVLFKITCLITS